MYRMNLLKNKKTLAITCVALLLLACGTEKRAIPDGFGYVHEVVPEVEYDIRYYTHDNFVGAPVDGYLAPVAILTNEALEAFQNVANDLREQGYGVIVYDGYRPQKAVDHFVRWAQNPSDTLTKQKYYPDVDKADLFDLGYIAEQSSHTRGSTIDLTLTCLETGDEIDMGSGFDFFGPVSHHDTDLITPAQRDNRTVLKETMQRHGFLMYPYEWWHYTLDDEPYPDTYFDFDVE